MLSRIKWITRRSLWVHALIVMIVTCMMSLTIHASSPTNDGVPEGTYAHLVDVRFQSGLGNAPVSLLPDELQHQIWRVDSLFTASDAQLLDFINTGERMSNRSLANLNGWRRIELRSDADGAAFLDALIQQEIVEVAEFAPMPVPSPAITPDFTALQGYLGDATDGIDADYAWGFAGGNGAGVTIYDVEYAWNQNHEDLSKAAGVTQLVNAGDIPVDPFSDNNHGTAVIGQLIADNDDKGVTGISWGSDIGLAPPNTANLGYNPANAILLAVADGQAGDIILIEQQATVCGLPWGRYGPSEWFQSTFDAVSTATANGFIVVAAAGNGNVDLDQAGCNDRFDRTVRDSGAIIVGAGGAPTGASDRERLGFSSYGSRVDVQGWGHLVMTTGYGGHYVDADDPSDPNKWYTDSFNGTSSASPIVTGAAANLQGYYMTAFGSPLTSVQMRTLLAATGSPQLGDTTENIGPRPNLQAIIQALGANTAPDAVDDGAVTDEDVAVNIDVLTNDEDVDGDTFDITATTNPSFGSIIVNANDTITYTPNLNYFGLDEFTYTITDTPGDSDMATVTIVINPVNDPPVITVNSALVTTNEGTQANNWGTVSDVDSPVITLSATVGTMVDNNDGTYNWSHDVTDGPDQSQLVTLTADDGNLSSNTDFQLTVDNVNPTATFAYLNAPNPIIVGNPATFGFSNQYDPSPEDTAFGFAYTGICDNSNPVVQNLAAPMMQCMYTVAGDYVVIGTIADKNNGSSSYPIVIDVLSVEEAIEYLQGLIDQLEDDGYLTRGQANALSQKLSQALRSYDKGQTHTAVNQMNAFVNQVNDFIDDGVLPQAEGDALLALAQQIIAGMLVS